MPIESPDARGVDSRSRGTACGFEAFEPVRSMVVAVAETEVALLSQSQGRFAADVGRIGHRRHVVGVLTRDEQIILDIAVVGKGVVAVAHAHANALSDDRIGRDLHVVIAVAAVVRKVTFDRGRVDELVVAASQPGIHRTSDLSAGL